MPVLTPRKRGAQPGNRNALKHGFYAQGFSDLEARDLEEVDTLDLTDEIAMLRVTLRRVFNVIAEADEPEEARQALATLGQAAGRLAALLKAQKVLQGAGNQDAAAALSQALDGVLKEFRPG